MHEQWLKAVGALHIQCGQDIGPEETRVIVFLVQGDPAEPQIRGLQRLCPGREEGGFAEASGSRDQGEGVLEALLE